MGQQQQQFPPGGPCPEGRAAKRLLLPREPLPREPAKSTATLALLDHRPRQKAGKHRCVDRNPMLLLSMSQCCPASQKTQWGCWGCVPGPPRRGRPCFRHCCIHGGGGEGGAGGKRVLLPWNCQSSLSSSCPNVARAGWGRERAGSHPTGELAKNRCPGGGAATCGGPSPVSLSAGGGQS